MCIITENKIYPKCTVLKQNPYKTIYRPFKKLKDTIYYQIFLKIGLVGYENNTYFLF